MSAAILIVEDEAQVLILAESLLQEAGYETASASTLAEAQAIIHSDAKLDLVFTDLGLGEDAEAGIAIGQLVGQARSGMPVLYTSGRLVTDGMKSLLVERSAFLSKPYTAQDLLEAVASLIPKA